MASPSFPSLESVSEIEISETGLSAMPDFPLISSLAEGVKIRDITALETLGGLGNLQSAGTNITIFGNSSLTAIDLPETILFDGSFNHENNTSLENCGNSASICTILSQATSPIVENNGNLCARAEAVAGQCLLSTNDGSQKLELSVNFRAGSWVIRSNQYFSRSRLELFSIQRKRVFPRNAAINTGEDRFQTPKLSLGIYLLSLQDGANFHQAKVFVSEQ